jgi:hypothetical protein
MNSTLVLKGYGIYNANSYYGILPVDSIDNSLSGISLC